MTLISIVTPSFNQGRFLRATIESVVSQTGVEFEYTVVDGGSRDNSLEILKGYGSRFKWISETDKGQADAIDKGFRMSRGEILGWLNSDDLYCPGTLSRVLEEFDKDPNVMMVYGKGRHIDAEGKALDEHPSSEFELEALSYGCFICQPACLFRRSLYDAAGGLDLRLQYALDLDMWIKFGLLMQKNSQWKFSFIPLLLARSRMHETSKTIAKRHQAYLEIMAVVKKHFNHVPFNRVYGAEETASGQYDGYFSRRPFGLVIFLRSLMKWGWSNRHDPIYVCRIINECLLNPRESAQRIGNRTGARF
jgi:glycosyltransferase involved in cell wall biosynthesis